MAAKESEEDNSGVRQKVEPWKNLHEKMMAFFTMRQGWTEEYDDYLNRFNLRLKNMEMSGGEHLLYSLQLKEKN